MSETRKQLMQKLLEHKETGLTVDQLSGELGITRTGVQQHLLGLERDGHVVQIDMRSTRGRPSRVYGLSDRGYEQFPRNYALLAQGFLATASEMLSEEAVESLLGRMAERIAGEALPSLEKREGAERVTAVVELMNELGYEASPLPEGGGIAAANCVYHKVAEQTRAVCRYDVKLLSLLLDEPVRHDCCMLDGDGSCTFSFDTGTER